MVKNFNGQRLRQARLYNGLSINDLAEILSVTKQAISQYETHNVTPEFEKNYCVPPYSESKYKLQKKRRVSTVILT